MGSFAQLEIDGYEIYSTKNSVENEVMTIFRESEQAVIPKSPPNEPVFGETVDSQSGETDSRVVYTCEVWKVRDRLDIMGFTLTRVKREFQELLSQHVESIDWMKSDLDFDPGGAEEHFSASIGSAFIMGENDIKTWMVAVQRNKNTHDVSWVIHATDRKDKLGKGGTHVFPVRGLECEFVLETKIEKPFYTPCLTPRREDKMPIIRQCAAVFVQ